MVTGVSVPPSIVIPVEIVHWLFTQILTIYCHITKCHHFWTSCSLPTVLHRRVWKCHQPTQYHQMSLLMWLYCSGILERTALILTSLDNLR